MNVSPVKNRTLIGKILFQLPEWRRNKIKERLTLLGLSEGKWRSIHERLEAHLLPAFVRDVIVEELPETADLFVHPQFKTDGAA